MYSNQSRIVLGNASLAKYPEGGGHWSWFVQYPLGLKALGHDILWLELLRSTGDPTRDNQLVRSFFELVRRSGMRENCALLLLDHGDESQALENSLSFGRSRTEILEFIRSADLLWNFCCSLRQPLLSLFRRRVLIDVDPGHLQVSGLSWDLGIKDHDSFLTIGRKLNDPESRIPNLGLRWQTFQPFVYLPAWELAPDPGSAAPFSSVTQWTWEELLHGEQILSVSKRSAYLKYVGLPRQARRPFELAANIGETDPAGDRELLRENGWSITDPHDVVNTPERYRQYIQSSRAELMCAKPIHIELRTGWFSDRSVAYLASGRPVLAEDTGFTEHLPTGEGLMAFSDLESAVASVAQIDSDYARHSRAARELAEAHFDSARCLEYMLAASDH